MKRRIAIITAVLIITILCSCTTTEYDAQLVATTLPVYDFTSRLCEGTEIKVDRLITEEVSCLHDYTMQVSQMKRIESADAVIISGIGLESFLDDALKKSNCIINASKGIDIHHHTHAQHHDHDADPHIWLSPENAKSMAINICDQLCAIYPAHTEKFKQNLAILTFDINVLSEYATEQLGGLKNKDIITFHDGFQYMAEAFDLNIVKAVEEESGSEASAAELIEICNLVTDYSMKAIFIEKNGSCSAANIIAREAGVQVYTLDMAISGNSYFDAMYHNINTLKEALE